MSTKVAAGALAYARYHQIDRIFCGHTHDAMHEEHDGIHYYNSGGWIDSRLTYITIGEEGVLIHEYQEPSEEGSREAMEDESGSAAFDDFDSHEDVHQDHADAVSTNR